MARGLKCLNLLKIYLSLGLRQGILARSLTTAPSKINKILYNKGPDHLQITAHSTRIPVMANAVVTDIRLETPSVRGLTLQIDNPLFTFKAGQWVDMFIPGVEKVGGYSMYSSPNQLKENGTLELGIKFSTWPPAFWIHNQCKIGSEVQLRVGGDFYFDPGCDDSPSDLLLLAGGVGLNPIASIYFHAVSLQRKYQETQEKYFTGKVKLLYTAKSHEELLYKSLLDSVSSTAPNAEIKYFITRETPSKENNNVTYSHINENVIKSVLQSLDLTSLRTFICGPPTMIKDMNKHLLQCGLTENQIRFEKWW